MNTVPLIHAEELLNIHHRPEVIIIDASGGKDAREHFEAEHLEGAHFLDLNSQLADIKSDFALGGRHPLPGPEAFAQTLTELGVEPASHIIIYDHQGGANAAARLWWMLKSIGHEKVQVLNGGFAEAKRRGFPMKFGIQRAVPSANPYPATAWQWPTIAMNEVGHAAQDPSCVVVDVRDKARYDGITEPIDLIAGHIPGAVNIPFALNLNAEGLFRSPAELREFYRGQFGDIPARKITVHCGSGVTACHTILALAHAGLEIPNLYVGSWSEWSRNGKPMGVTKAE